MPSLRSRSVATSMSPALATGRHGPARSPPRTASRLIHASIPLRSATATPPPAPPAFMADATRPGKHVRIVEVGPRDGLQNEPTLVDTATKLELIDRLARTGLRTIEATSFVSKKLIPQLADAAEVLTGIRARGGLPSTTPTSSSSPSFLDQHDRGYLPHPISYPVLVPTIRHMELAVQAGVREIAVFASASEGFSRKNINCTRAESLERFRPVCTLARSRGMRVRGYISCVVGCPYDGQVSVRDVAWLTKELLAMGCYEISLGDTTGIGTPGMWKRLLLHLLHDARISPTVLALHCHDTYGQALANCAVGLELGIRAFDASVAGLGGCPFAKGATGNLATEDLVYMLHGSGYTTGIDLLALANTGDWISRRIHRNNASRAGSAIVRSTPKL
ncbi:hypothetical protein PYCC9005_003280 [Savitreella phatthalungensis]